VSESKKDRFKRVAEKRTNNIIKTLKLLGNCSNKGNYEYTKTQVDLIFKAIEKELKITKNQFHKENNNKEFKL
jgi:hypothetical protein